MNSHPKYHEFSLADDSLAHTFYRDDDNLVPTNALLVISLALPIIQIISIFGFSSCCMSRKLWNIHCALLAFLASHSFQTAVVSILKIVTGAPRPDLIQRCVPSSFDLPPFGSLSNVAICTNAVIREIDEGFKSFPSGHASTSFTSATFSFFVFASRHRIFDNRGVAFKIFVSILPFFFSTFITATRYSDNRHFFIDLIAGVLIGIFASCVGYHFYFPYFKDVKNGGKAFPPRRIGAEKKYKGVGGFWKLPEDDLYEYDDRASTINDESSSGSSTDSPLPPKSKHSNYAYNKSRPHTSTTMYTVKLKPDKSEV